MILAVGVDTLFHDTLYCVRSGTGLISGNYRSAVYKALATDVELEEVEYAARKLPSHWRDLTIAVPSSFARTSTRGLLIELCAR